jgi:hypothetical protein
MSAPDVKKYPFIVSAHEVDFFKTNYPIHYAVLEDLIAKGEARIADKTGA